MNSAREYLTRLINDRRTLAAASALAALGATLFIVTQRSSDPLSHSAKKSDSVSTTLNPAWIAPDTTLIPFTPEGDLIRYGRKLISNTVHYLGPMGIVSRISNRMNCQNCHIDAGTKSFGNSFAGVAPMYPLFRARSGIVESIEFRINDCLQRSMNGQTLDTAAREMKAMVAYLKWVGKDVPKKTKPFGAGTAELTYLNRRSDTLKGRIVYVSKCKLCHGKNGEGIKRPGEDGFIYPPLWGPESYNTGAGLFRISRFAAFVKYSMPFGARYDKPQLSNEEAWDVAAFVNSMPRPRKAFLHDWPDIRKKAVDYPYGPYADHFSESDHKFGPFGPIKTVQDSLLKGTNAGK